MWDLHIPRPSHLRSSIPQRAWHGHGKHVQLCHKALPHVVRGLTQTVMLHLVTSGPNQPNPHCASRRVLVRRRCRCHGLPANRQRALHCATSCVACCTMHQMTPNGRILKGQDHIWCGCFSKLEATQVSIHYIRVCQPHPLFGS